jgi:hypothetical protein
MQLSVSTDGRTWRLVPNDQFPSPAVLLPPQIGGRMPAVGTANGFLFVAEGNDVWASEDGYTWHRSADRARDNDLRAGTILAVAAGGPGLVAVGNDNQAWYSNDGSDWTLAEVPAPPTESFAAQGYSTPRVDMQGIVVAGDRLVAWGNAAATNAADTTMVAPVLWSSEDGVSWATVGDVAGIGWLSDVAAGPDGFVAIGGADLTDAGGIWFSADSRVWEAAEAKGFRDAQRSSPEVTKSSIAAASSGYVAVAGEAGCAVGPCPGARAVIWSSPDGRSWSRMPSDDRFESAWATSVDAWDSHFVVAGTYDASPAIWISGTPTAPETAVVSPTPSSDQAPTPAPQPSAQVAPPADPNVTDLLNAFLESRVAGEGAEQYIAADSPDDGVPLLYATSSGARYERAEFERVDGIEWPYEWTAYTARLFAGDTVVEQLLFVSNKVGRLGLGYVPDGFGTDIPPTTENGEPVPAPYDAFGGEVTLHLAHPWVSRTGTGPIKLIPEGAGPTTDGGERNGWDRLVIMADPARTGPNCPTAPGPLDATALAESIRSDPELQATDPVAVGAAGAEGLMMDVVSRVGAGAGCGNLLGDGLLLDYESVGWGNGPRRLYLFDAPEESSMRLLAIAISVPESHFDRAVEWAGPIVEFNAP